MSTKVSPPITLASHRRRDVLIAGASLVSGMSLGCHERAEPLPTPQPPRRDVPLRIVYCGNESDREAILRAWAGVNSQPLDLVLIPVNRSDTTGLVAQITKESKKCDVIVYPLLAMADLFSSESLTPFSDHDFEITETQGGRFLAALRNGVARFGGDFVAAPLGTYQPALMSVDAVDDIDTWSDYDRWVASLDGSAAEPLAAGWAAMMYLWRAASTTDHGWLFSHRDFEPTIDSDPHVSVLVQMRETARRYKIKRSTPQEIWAALMSGSLGGGLGFALSSEPADREITFSHPPTEVSPRVVVDPFASVASLSATCRQSSASKQFIDWISGGQGSERAQRQVTLMTSTRVPSGLSEGGVAAENRGYDLWLRDRLRTPNTMPTLRLLAAGEYYAALDQHVIAAIDGETEPNVALATVAEKWREISARVGIENQQHAWHRAKGMRA